MQKPRPKSPKWLQLSEKALSADQLLELRLACIANAEALIDDSRRLLEAGAWPRSYALAHTASEELTKAASAFVIYVEILGGRTIGSQDWVDFWIAWENHVFKSRYALAINAFFQSVVRRLEEGGDEPSDIEGFISEIKSLFATLDIRALEVVADNERDLRDQSLYVDWRAGPIKPSEVVTAKMAAGKIAAASDGLQMAHGLTDVTREHHELLEWMAQFGVVFWSGMAIELPPGQTQLTITPRST